MYAEIATLCKNRRDCNDNTLNAGFCEGGVPKRRYYPQGQR